MQQHWHDAKSTVLFQEVSRLKHVIRSELVLHIQENIDYVVSLTLLEHIYVILVLGITHYELLRVDSLLLVVYDDTPSPVHSRRRSFINS